MSLQAKLLLVLLALLNSNVSPMRLSRNSRHNGTANKFRHLADHSMHDSSSTINGDLDKLQNEATLVQGEQYTGRHVKKLKENAKSMSLGVHRDGELGQIDLSLACNDAQTKLSLSDRPQSKGSRGLLSMDVLESCGYAVSKGQENTTVVVKDCDVTLGNGYCSTRMKYETIDGQLADVTLPCTAPSHRSYPNDRPFDGFINSGVQSDSPIPTPTQEYKCTIPGSTESLGPRCKIHSSQRIPCGHSGITSQQCLAKGCCFVNNNCLYPLNECTADKHFVFMIRGNLSDSSSLDLTKLKTSGASDCLPMIVTKDFAIFFFSTTACGTRTYDIGDFTIHSVEVVTSLSRIPAISGDISRDMQFRVMVECRYAKSPQHDSSIVSAGLMVQSIISEFPMVQSEGLFSVELRISEDATYTKFYPSYHPPLRVLLGKSVYLEVRLKSAVSKPLATLLVHYCIAYPKLATKALVLLHDGCPNPQDNGGVFIIRLPGNTHERRFEVTAFQFMATPVEYLDVQIYFLCSTELCFHMGRPCEEGCFIL